MKNQVSLKDEHDMLLKRSLQKEDLKNLSSKTLMLASSCFQKRLGEINLELYKEAVVCSKKSKISKKDVDLKKKIAELLKEIFSFMEIIIKKRGGE